MALRYSFLSLAILSLISLSFQISSSVGEISQGSGIVNLLYSSLLFKLMWVSLVMMYDSGGDCGLVLVLYTCLGLLFVFRFRSGFVWLVPGLGLDSDSGTGSDPDPDPGLGSVRVRVLVWVWFRVQVRVLVRVG